jgi:glycosyltransferase involved in cell wall biosynthesis
LNVLTYVHLRNIYGSTGVGRVARELTEHLAQHPEVTLEVLADHADHASIVEKVGAPWTGFRYRLFKYDTSRQQALWFLTNRPTAEQYWPDVELVYCTAESYVPVRRAKLVVTSHDMQLFEPGAHALSRNLLKQRLKWRLLFSRLAKKVDLFHAISAYSAERMAHYYPEIRSRLRVIPNAVSDAFFRPPTPEGDAVLTRLGLAGRPYVLVPGGLHHRKNADLILKAWPMLHARHTDLTLVVINHNSPAYVARAAALAPSLMLGGYQTEANLVALYNHAQVVWFPSRYEGFGMPVLEAMACGSSVVTSNTAALPEVSGGAAAALLDPDRAGDHVEAISALLNDETARQRAAGLGRQRAATFRWTRSSEMLVRAFGTIL